MEKQLWIASQEGDLKAVQECLSKGAKVNARNEFGETALFKAAEAGHASIVKLLLKAGADPNIPRLKTAELKLKGAVELINIFGESPLITAGDHAEIVRILVDAGANLNATRCDGLTALSLAAYFGYFDTVRVLLEAGADRKKLSDQGHTAEKLAASQGHKKIADLINGSNLGVYPERKSPKWMFWRK